MLAKNRAGATSSRLSTASSPKSLQPHPGQPHGPLRRLPSDRPSHRVPTMKRPFRIPHLTGGPKVPLEFGFSPTDATVTGEFRPDDLDRTSVRARSAALYRRFVLGYRQVPFLVTRLASRSVGVAPGRVDPCGKGSEARRPAATGTEEHAARSCDTPGLTSVVGWFRHLVGRHFLPGRGSRT